MKRIRLIQDELLSHNSVRHAPRISYLSIWRWAVPSTDAIRKCSSQMRVLPGRPSLPRIRFGLKARERTQHQTAPRSGQDRGSLSELGAGLVSHAVLSGLTLLIKRIGDRAYAGIPQSIDQIFYLHFAGWLGYR